MCFDLEYYTDDMSDEWHSVLDVSPLATFMHTRPFLEYHRERFSDQSLVIRSGGKAVAVLPANVDPNHSSGIVSHSGTTFGGLIFDPKLIGSSLISVIESIFAFYIRQGFTRLVYRSVPLIYHKSPCQDDLYALGRLGVSKAERRLSTTIKLNCRRPRSTRRRRCHSKALTESIVLCDDLAYLGEFWEIIKHNLSTKHNVAPTHSFREMATLFELFPSELEFMCALHGNQVVAGVVIFRMNSVDHLQYVGSNAIGNSIHALDLVIESAIQNATSRGQTWFDFGVSTVPPLNTLNEGLYKFKTEFGGGEQFRKF